MDFEFRRHSRYLEAIVHGRFDMAVGKRVIDEAFHRSTEYGLDRILIDARGIPAQVSIAARFTLADYLAAASPRPHRVALVVQPVVVNYTKTFEHTANNRGARVLTTDSLTAAFAFLEIEK